MFRLVRLLYDRRHGMVCRVGRWPALLRLLRLTLVVGRTHVRRRGRSGLVVDRRRGGGG